MKQNSSGWKGESRRHSLARKGVKTTLPDGRRFDVSKFVANGQDEVCWRCGGTGTIQHPNHIGENVDCPSCSGGQKYPEDAFATGESLEAFLETPLGEEYIEDHFESLYEIPFNDWSEEEGIPYWIDNYENMVTGERVFKRDFENELMENVYGYHDGYRLGENRSMNGKEYYYAGSIGSDSELELQADNGELVYYNIGNNFFRIWKRFPETYISLRENGKFELIHNHKKINETDQEYLHPPQMMKDLAKKLGRKEPIVWDEHEERFVKE